MSNWDIDYHLQKLESYSSQKWAPLPPTMSSALAQLKAMQAALTMLKTAAMLLTVMTFTGMCSIGMGVTVGILGIYRTVGPTVAFILGGLAVFAASLAVRLVLAIRYIPRFEGNVAASEEFYQQALDKAVQG